MKIVYGSIQNGCGDFKRRMIEYPNVFEEATGEKLFPGTLNVHISSELPIKEHFRVLGSDINEPEQDLLFEVCRINRLWAYRIRPLHLESGMGGHGDHVMEIACSLELRNQTGFDASNVEILFF